MSYDRYGDHKGGGSDQGGFWGGGHGYGGHGGGRDDSELRLNISRHPAVKRNLGVGDDVVEISADRGVPQVRLTFTGVEVGTVRPPTAAR